MVGRQPLARQPSVPTFSQCGHDGDGSGPPARDKGGNTA